MADFKAKNFRYSCRNNSCRGRNRRTERHSNTYKEKCRRFGLSQLHQLGACRRGLNFSHIASFRLRPNRKKRASTANIMTQTNDGFVISEKRFGIKRPGEFLGTRQSGLPDLIISDIVKDAKILEIARNSAIEFVECYELDKFPALKSATPYVL